MKMNFKRFAAVLMVVVMQPAAVDRGFIVILLDRKPGSGVDRIDDQPDMAVTFLKPRIDVIALDASADPREHRKLIVAI